MTLASGKATAKQTVNVVAKNDTGLESQPTTAMTPADVTTPTIGDITGDSTTGYEITGTADPNTTIEVRNPDGTILVQRQRMIKETLLWTFQREPLILVIH